MSVSYQPSPGESISLLQRLGNLKWWPYLFQTFAPSFSTDIDPNSKWSKLNLPCPKCQQSSLLLDHQTGGIRCLGNQCGHVTTAVNELPRLTGLSRDDLAGRVSQYVQQHNWQLPIGDTQLMLRDEAYHGLAGEFVLTLDQYSEADPVAVLLHFLTFFGICIGNGPHLQIACSEHPARLFSCIVGRTGNARKGTAYGLSHKVFQRVDPAFAMTRCLSGLTTGEGLIHHVRDADGDDPGAPDKRLLLVEDEFSRVLIQMQKTGSILGPVVMQAWDHGNLASLPRHNPYRSTGAHIGIIGHITASELERRMSSRDCASGFANRFLWAISSRSKELSDPEVPPEQLFDAFAFQLAIAVTHGKSMQTMRRDAAAQHIWNSQYSHLSRARDGVFGEATDRAAPYVLRLALIYALLDCSPEIQDVHLRAALAVWDYCEVSARRIFGDPRRTNKVAQRIHDALMNTNSPGGLDRTAISGLFQRHKSQAEIDEAIRSLRIAGMLDEQVQQTGGRPRTVYIGIPAPKI